MILSKKDLGIVLSTLREFDSPKPELEQYVTPSHIAAELLWYAYMHDDIANKIIFDLGAGTGVLSFGALLLGAKKVVGIETDSYALKIARQNEKIIEKLPFVIGEIEWVQKDIFEISLDSEDTIIMNPPFGVQKPHADRKFLEKAFSSRKVVYALLKASNEKFIQKFSKDFNYHAELFSMVDFPLKATMKFHEKKKYLVKVGLWRFYYEGS